MLRSFSLLSPFRYLRNHGSNEISRPHPTAASDWKKLHAFYGPLQDGEIRLAVVAPGQQGDCIRCNLHTVALKDKPIYEALSYCWGTAAPKKHIFIEGVKVEVQESLESALRHLRHEYNERVIWIDAICINQEDLVEKSWHISIMRNIYEQSAELVIWLGEGTADSDLAMDSIVLFNSEMGSSHDFNTAAAYNLDVLSAVHCAPASFDPEPWMSIIRLCRRPWWERAWVIQEVFTPSNSMTVACGDKQVPWVTFSRIMIAMVFYGTRFLPFMAKFGAAGLRGETFFPENPLQLSRRIWRKGHSDSDLLSHLWNFRYRKASDPRDKIYALLGISTGLSEHAPRPDYRKSVEDVYSEWAAFILKSEQNLKILGACQNPRRHPQLPSWVPDWNYEYRSPERRALTCWVDSEGTGISGHPKFRATGDTTPFIDISADCRTLTVKGLLLQTIISVGEVVLGGDPETSPAYQGGEGRRIFKAWHWLVENSIADPYPNGQSRHEAFWRTLITDIIPKNDAAAKEAMEESFELFLNPPRDVSRNLDEYLTSEAVRKSLEFQGSLSIAIQERRLFVTREGYIGLALEDAEVGDCVCLVWGAEVPFVLRKVDGQYKLIGECYCHGIMDGEGIKELEEGRIKVEEFRLH